MNVLTVTAILALGLLATIMASVLSVNDLISKQYTDQIIQARLEEAATAIQRNSIVMNGVRYVPAADDSGVYATIPAWVMPDARTPSGAAFHYCPFATRDLAGTMPANTTTITNNKPSGSTYPASTINIFNHPYTRAHNYVYARARMGFTGTGAALAPSDVLAVIVAPVGSNTISSDCPGSIDANGHVTIANHYVRVVANPQPVQQQLAAKNETAIFYVGANASGDGSGIDINNRITMDGVFAQLHAMKPWRAHLYLAAGAYTWNNSSNASAGQSYPKGNFRQIEYIVEGATAATTTIAINDDMDLPVNWRLKNLTLNFTGIYRLSSPPMNTIIAENLIIYGGGLQLNGGEMHLLGTDNVINNGLYVTDGGRLVINGTLSSSVPIGGIEVRGGGRINLLHDQSWTVYSNATSAPITNSNGSYQRAPIYLRTGGRLTVEGNLSITRSPLLGRNLYTGIDTDIGSQLVIAKSTLSGTSPTLSIDRPLNHGIYLNGEMHADHANLITPSWSGNTNAYIYLINGGELSLHNGTVMGDSADVSKRPYFGIMDKSGNGVYGGDTSQDGSSAVTIYVNASASGGYSRCWVGDLSYISGSVYNTPHLFIDSSTAGAGTSPAGAVAIGTNGTYSDPQDRPNFEYLRLQNISHWACIRN